MRWKMDVRKKKRRKRRIRNGGTEDVEGKRTEERKE